MQPTVANQRDGGDPECRDQISGDGSGGRLHEEIVIELRAASYELPVMSFGPRGRATSHQQAVRLIAMAARLAIDKARSLDDNIRNRNHNDEDSRTMA